MTADYLVVGAGVVGLTVALELKRRHPDCSVMVIEKEPTVGFHASGRNSGVLHAGFYYTADSLKAKLTRDGGREMSAYCEDRRIAVNRCGKLVVARSPADLEGLAELLRRGAANGVELQELDEKQAKEIEPRAKTLGRALFSPNTSTVDPKEVMAALLRDAQAAGIQVLTCCPYLGRTPRGILTGSGIVEFGVLLNAAGLQADRVAHDFGFGRDYRTLPFKGLYLYSDEPPDALRTNVYPVPDLRNPFLGVHFTKTASGRFKIGPTAIPCLWREQYGWLERFSPRDWLDVARVAAPLFLRAGFDFRALAVQEIRKYWRPHLVSQAAALVEGVQVGQYRKWAQPGIRAQLVDVRQRKLVTDFCIEGDERSVNVLNAVSPAFTCAFAFARLVCDRMAGGSAEPTLSRAALD